MEMQHFRLQNSAKGANNLKVRATAGLERLLAKLGSKTQKDDDTDQKYRHRLEHEIAVLDGADLQKCLLIVAEIAGYMSVAADFWSGRDAGVFPVHLRHSAWGLPPSTPSSTISCSSVSSTRSVR
jgi:hypothetical protein